ncbi:hypothetical protein FACS189440_06850 [Bacteroidia bacterium]|nr:hypothetical protein FACS189440_06850 [Bacteroidia bacterium]
MKPIKIILTVCALFVCTCISAQDFAHAGAALTTASEAYESGDYRTALSNVATFEQALGKGTTYSHYLKIMSFYQLKEYENCIQQVRKYQQTATEEDDYFAEISQIYAEAQRKKAAVKQVSGGINIGGIVWAICNVGSTPGKFAANPKVAGGLYTWTEAQKACPAGWRLPTKEELEVLLSEDSKWTDKGREFGSGSNTIYLPAAGWRDYLVGILWGVGKEVYYWSSTFDSTYDVREYTYTLFFDSGYAEVGSGQYKNKQSVRCVCADK